jgi:NAD(P)-dependent dehydrogenase (short-subunit alcohol dehydrogenase family)
MITTLVIGGDDSLVEGIVQALASAGHRSHVVRSLQEAATAVAELRPLVTLVARGCASDPEFLRLRLPAGGALVLYRSHDDTAPPVPPSVQRLTLADVELPLERQRLVALVQRLTERAVAAGRASHDVSNEDRAR